MSCQGKEPLVDRGLPFGYHATAVLWAPVLGWAVSRAEMLVGGLIPQLHSLSHPPAGECYELHIHCKTSFVGYFPATVLWELLGPGELGSEGTGTFYIARFLAAIAHSPLAAQLKPTTPFTRTQVTGNPVVTNRIEEGERPDR